MLQVSINYIAIDSEYYAGKPRIARTRIPVATIAQLYLKQEETLEAIASKYDLNQVAVYAAMAYYYDHKAEIARQTAESTAWVEEMKRNTP
ncbi:MAG: DUF433 domain-containing protein [Cyanobacteria bacterium J06642_3]